MTTSFMDGVRAFFGTPPPPPPSVQPQHGPLTLTRETIDPILLPAQGDAFDFQMHAVFTWHSRSISMDELAYWADHLADRARRTLFDRVADIAREYPPHEARRLEGRLRSHLGDNYFHCAHDGMSLRFQVRVRVDPDERVRERLRPFWEQRIAMECQQELDLLRVKLVDELTHEWSAILKKLEEDPSTPHAARLSEEQFASVFGDFVTERKRVVVEITDLLKEAVNRHGTLGLAPSDYTKAWDEALNAFRRKYAPDA